MGQKNQEKNNSRINNTEKKREKNDMKVAKADK